MPPLCDEVKPIKVGRSDNLLNLGPALYELLNLEPRENDHLNVGGKSLNLLAEGFDDQKRGIDHWDVKRVAVEGRLPKENIGPVEFPVAIPDAYHFSHPGSLDSTMNTTPPTCGGRAD